MRHVDVRLGDDLEGRVHTQHRYAEVDHVDVHVGNVFGDGTAAADIDLAQLADLPLDVVLREHGADLAHELS